MLPPSPVAPRPAVALLADLNMELSVAVASEAYVREAAHVFQGLDLGGLLVLPTMQRTTVELVAFDAEADAQKDSCLEKFFAIAAELCAALAARGHWADYIDPASGLPMLTPDCNKVFNEVQSAQLLLGYAVMDANCCKIICHPAWGSSVYPASILTTAPQDEVLALARTYLEV